MLAIALVLVPWTALGQPTALEDDLSQVDRKGGTKAPEAAEVPLIAFSPDEPEPPSPMPAGAAALLVGAAVFAIGTVGALLLLRRGEDEGESASPKG